MGQTGIVEIWEICVFYFLCVLGCLQQNKAVLIYEVDNQKRGLLKNAKL